MAANASELFHEMLDRVERHSHARRSFDVTSPCDVDTVEAAPGCVFNVQAPMHNLVDCRPVDPRWAGANVLHFFTGSEEAGALRYYNRYADKFLVGDTWRGAYGAAALDQLKGCVKLLRRSPDSRRAIITMPGYDEENEDVNRPACWTSLHLLRYRGTLDLLVYQRSLNLIGVMPYDAILLSNVLLYASHFVGMPSGVLRWCVGSLHRKLGDRVDLVAGRRNLGLIYPPALLDDATECARLLKIGDV